MDDRIKELRKITHQICNDLSGVRTLVEMYTSGLRPELDSNRLLSGLDRLGNSVNELRDCLSRDR
ncbi:MAG: hypothetical protein HY788_20885 [Deltaproteobacteria bacterium]|nr:hypothetical protein [Deltaproteobacteria bacterium]